MSKTKTEEEKAFDKLAKEAKKLGVEVVDGDTLETLEAKVAPLRPTKVEKNSTTFVFKNGGTRTFSDSVHGEDWESLADEFQATNAGTIASRDGEAL